MLALWKVGTQVAADKCTLRKLLFVTVMVPMCFSLSACVPGFGGAPVAPISLNFSGNEARVYACVEDSQIASIFAEYREDDGAYGVLIDASAPSKSDGFPVPYGSSFPLGKPLPPLRASQIHPLPSGTKFQNIIISISFIGDERSADTWPTFHSVDPATLNSDQYVYSDGRVSDQPCNMYK